MNARDLTNSAAFDSLVRQARSPRGVAPFVGAGLSADWRFQTWGDFLVNAGQQASIEPEIQDDVEASRFEEAAERLEKALGRRVFNRLISIEFGPEPATDVSDPAVRYLPRIATGPVVTTNFDRVLEWVFRDHGVPFSFAIWGAKARLAADALIEDYPVLLKLHGDAGDERDRVFTRTEYERHYASPGSSTLDPNKPLARLLLRIFETRPVLFVGCSLRNDRCMPLVGAADRTVEEHFAILPLPRDAASRDARIAALASHGVTVIGYPAGDHRYVRDLLRALADSVKTRTRGVFGVPSLVPGADQADVRLPSADAVRARNEEIARKRALLLERWDAAATLEERLVLLAEDGPFLRDAELLSDFDRLAASLARRVARQSPATAAPLWDRLYFVNKRLGRRRRARNYLERAWRSVRHAENSPVKAEIGHNYASELELAGRPDEAIPLYEQVIAMAKAGQSDDPESTWRKYGRALVKSDRAREGRRWIVRAIRAARANRDARSEAIGWIALGDACGMADDWRLALRARLRAVDVLRPVALSESRWLSHALDDAGVTAFHLDDHQLALRLYVESLFYARDASDLAAEMVILMNIGWLHFFVAQDLVDDERRVGLEVSREYYDNAADRARALGERLDEHDVYAQRARVLAELGETDLALNDLKAAARFARGRDQGLLALAYSNMAVIELDLSRPAAALRHCRLGLRAAVAANDDGIRTTLLLHAGRAALSLDRHAEAAAFAEELARVTGARQDRYTPQYRALIDQVRAQQRQD